ncbi:YrhC family protein [Neobacillus bataviensis]|uniref:YrhC family protein n=1 Tax=Neobacillus bataviensis TaxID=220685 RepID=UPI001CBD1DC6|nr:YrhC family protein [Neobacillus bataviensis]
MEQQSKSLFEKIADFKRFALTLFAFGVFFYLGAIIPYAGKTVTDLTFMINTSISFLAASILFFIQVKRYQLKLLEIEDGHDDFRKK